MDATAIAETRRCFEPRRELPTPRWATAGHPLAALFREQRRLFLEAWGV